MLISIQVGTDKKAFYNGGYFNVPTRPRDPLNIKRPQFSTVRELVRLTRLHLK